MATVDQTQSSAVPDSPATCRTRTIVRPIDRLREAAGRLRRGEFTTLTPEGPTEIANLVSHFNAMGLAFSEREALLQTSERRYRGLMGSLSHILWTTDPQGGITTDVAGWRAFTGQDEAACGHGSPQVYFGFGWFLRDLDVPWHMAFPYGPASWVRKLAQLEALDLAGRSLG